MVNMLESNLRSRKGSERKQVGQEKADRSSWGKDESDHETSTINLEDEANSTKKRTGSLSKHLEKVTKSPSVLKQEDRDKRIQKLQQQIYKIQKNTQNQRLDMSLTTPLSRREDGAPLSVKDYINKSKIKSNVFASHRDSQDQLSISSGINQ